MRAESHLWDVIRNTRDPASEDRNMSRRLPFGILKRLDINWTAQGLGMGTSRYVMDVTEHQPKGRAAAILESTPSLEARLSSYTPPREDIGTMRAIYLAQLADGELITVSGRVLEADDHEGDAYREPRLWTPLFTMSPDEAVEGFESALADAHFV